MNNNHLTSSVAGAGLSDGGQEFLHSSGDHYEEGRRRLPTEISIGKEDGRGKCPLFLTPPLIQPNPQTEFAF